MHYILLFAPLCYALLSVVSQANATSENNCHVNFIFYKNYSGYGLNQESFLLNLLSNAKFPYTFTRMDILEKHFPEPIDCSNPDRDVQFIMANHISSPHLLSRFNCVTHIMMHINLSREVEVQHSECIVRNIILPLQWYHNNSFESGRTSEFYYYYDHSSYTTVQIVLDSNNKNGSMQLKERNEFLQHLNRIGEGLPGEGDRILFSANDILHFICTEKYKNLPIYLLRRNFNGDYYVTSDKGFNLEHMLQPLINVREIAMEIFQNSQGKLIPYRYWSVTTCFNLTGIKSFRDLPLDSMVYPSSELTVVNAVFHKELNISDGLICRFYNHNYQLRWDNGKNISPIIEVAFNIPLNERTSSAILFKAVTINFVSCVSLNGDKTSFEAYVQPFQTSVWIAILVAFVCVTFTLYSTLRFTKRLQNVPFVLYVVACMLEISYFVPKYLVNRVWFRILIGSFLLMGIVLTNCYKGIVIVDLTNERQYKKISSLKDIVNYGIQSTSRSQNNIETYHFTISALEHYYCYLNYSKINSHYEMELYDAFNFKNCSEWRVSNFKVNADIIAQAFQLCNKIDACRSFRKEYFWFTKLQSHFKNNLDMERSMDNHVYPPGFPKASVQQWIAECNNSAYFFDITQKYLFVNEAKWIVNGTKIIPKRKLYFGKAIEAIGEIADGVDILSSQALLTSFYRNRLYRIINSGIFAEWEHLSSTKNFTMCKHCMENLRKPLSLFNSNIITIFYILMLGTLTSFVAYLIEMCITFYYQRKNRVISVLIEAAEVVECMQ